MVAADTISTSTFRKELEIAWAASQTAILFGNHYILRRQSHHLQPTVCEVAKLLRFSLLAGYTWSEKVLNRLALREKHDSTAKFSSTTAQGERKKSHHDGREKGPQLIAPRV